MEAQAKGLQMVLTETNELLVAGVAQIRPGGFEVSPVRYWPGNKYPDFGQK